MKKMFTKWQNIGKENAKCCKQKWGEALKILKLLPCKWRALVTVLQADIYYSWNVYQNFISLSVGKTKLLNYRSLLNSIFQSLLFFVATDGFNQWRIQEACSTAKCLKRSPNFLKKFIEVFLLWSTSSFSAPNNFYAF